MELAGQGITTPAGAVLPSGASAAMRLSCGEGLSLVGSRRILSDTRFPISEFTAQENLHARIHSYSDNTRGLLPFYSVHLRRAIATGCRRQTFAGPLLKIGHQRWAGLLYPTSWRK